MKRSIVVGSFLFFKPSKIIISYLTLGGLSTLLLITACTTSGGTSLPLDNRPVTAIPASANSTSVADPSSLQSTHTSSLTKVPQVHTPLWIYTVSSKLSSPPVFTSREIYVVTDNGYIHSVDLQTGRETWETSVDRVPISAVNDVVYYELRGSLYALDSKTKQPKWTFQIHAGIESPPAIVNDTAYFGSDDGYLYALDNNTGAQKWRLKVGDGPIKDLAIGTGVIYLTAETFIAESYDTGFYEGSIHAIDIATRREQWVYKPTGSVDTTNFVDGVVYCLHRNISTQADVIYALDSQTGKQIWEYKPEAGTLSLPAIASQTLYMGTYSGKLSALDTNTHQERWTFAAQNWISVPVIVGDVIYFGSGDHYLYAVDRQTGQETWKFPTTGVVLTAPVMRDGVLFFADETQVYAVR
ncbi:MAG TPA: PQQ-binding-like beta-propeller repeat protein [Chloroflexia bacterium]|nr:PQQ-binding-like beta-propeller repeat protein [Chloroflexia bacterium]